jgi:flap endonuclease-1
MDSKGRVTSHLSGLFYRTTNLLSRGVKLIYVFDGEKSELKKRTIELREKRKEEAMKKYDAAKIEGNEGEMFKYSRQTSRLTEEMLTESKELLRALGVPVVNAAEEGEAQASFMARNDPEIYAVASQDYDCLLFGAPRLIQNLTFSKKKSLASGNVVSIQPEMISFEDVLNYLEISHEQLICLGILVGTDFNPGGIRGIGQKRALQIVKYDRQPVLIFEEIERLKNMGKVSEPDFKWEEIFPIFKNPSVNRDYQYNFEKINSEKVKELLCTKHEFSEERVNNAIARVLEQEESQKQKSIKDFF